MRKTVKTAIVFCAFLFTCSIYASDLTADQIIDSQKTNQQETYEQLYENCVQTICQLGTGEESESANCTQDCAKQAKDQAAVQNSERR